MKQSVRQDRLCSALPALALGAGGFALAGTTTLSLTYAGPQPGTLTVPWGDTLEITNDDSVSHSLDLVAPGAAVRPDRAGQTFTATITGAGSQLRLPPDRRQGLPRQAGRGDFSAAASR